MKRFFNGLTLSVILASGPLLSDEIQYPAAKKVDQVDNYHGTSVADPYRWLEDDRSPETAAWVQAENKITAEYFSKIPYRQELQARLKQLFNYPKYTAPIHRGPYFFFSKNDGLQNQSVWYVQTGLQGESRVLLDPNKFSADGTSRLLQFSPSRSGKYVAFAVSQGGSDWEEARVAEVATGRVLDDRLKWLKISNLAWSGDGFFYSRYPAPEQGRELVSKNENHSVYYHHLGDPQDKDTLIYDDKVHRQRFHQVTTTEDERYAILTIADRGTGKDGNALFYCDLSQGNSNFSPIVSEIGNSDYRVIDDPDGKFLVRTNWNAPRGRVVMFDPQNATSPWTDVLPQQTEILERAQVAGGKLVTTYSKDVASLLSIYSMSGKHERDIKLPGPGSVAAGPGGDAVEGNREDKVLFYSFSSFNYPPSIFRYDMTTDESTVLHSPDIPGFVPSAYETKEIFYKSKDGTRVPMFLVYKKGLKLNGANPTLLSAYGGFNISTNPTFSALRLSLLEQGFVYASANIRGGGEYGQDWHHAGMKLNKQNVFDDFIAAAEWLISNRYTSRDKLAIEGTSNGGLLMGAVTNQRPDLFRAVIAHAGVMDMLRFQKFTIGWNWIADYGSSENPEEFKALYAYSPIQNIKAGVRYPPVLITTADHDDRVIPGHSFKYAATMQEKVAHTNPVLIRIDTNSGHGPSSTTKQLEQTADAYAFLFYNLGVTPHFEGLPATAALR